MTTKTVNRYIKFHLVDFNLKFFDFLKLLLEREV